MYKLDNDYVKTNAKYYDVIQKNCYHDDIGEFVAYGIIGIDPLQVSVMHDITICRDTIVNMAYLFNQYQLSIVHMEDVITDMLS